MTHYSILLKLILMALHLNIIDSSFSKLSMNELLEKTECYDDAYVIIDDKLINVQVSQAFAGVKFIVVYKKDRYIIYHPAHFETYKVCMRDDSEADDKDDIDMPCLVKLLKQYNDMILEQINVVSGSNQASTFWRICDKI